MSTAENLMATMRANDREATHLRLFDIVEELEAIADELYESGGVITPEMEARLDALEGALPEKIDRICSVIQNNARAAEAAKAEADRLAALAKSRENTARGLKTYLLNALQKRGTHKVMCDRFTVRIQKNGRPSIQWTKDVAEIPEPFRRVRVELDGDAAYGEWRSTKQLPEGFAVELGSHLRIS